MKFFYKMFLGMTVILAVALGMIEYVTLSYSLEHAVKREQDSALSQHQMIKYSIETVILNMKSEDVDKELTDMMSQSAKSIVGDEGGMYLADDDGKRIYANSCNYEQKDIKVKDGTLTYSIVSKENTKDTGEKQSGRYIHVKSSFKLNDNRYILITESDITPVFDESKELRYRCSVYYIVILAVGMMVILILSWMITKPLAGLTATTKKFADGDYTARSDVKTRDEIGELAMAFNELAKNLESKVYELQMAAKKQSGIMQMLGEDDIVMLQSLESNYSKDTDSKTEQTYEAAPWQYGAEVALDDSIDNTISDCFVTSDISKELSAWIFIISFEDTRMLVAVDAVLGVPFYITYYCADVDSPKAQAAVMRDLYAKKYGSDYSMGDPKKSESKIDSSFETNIIENFYYGNNYTQGDDEYTGFEPYVYSCSSDKLQMEYQVITRIQRFEKKGKQVSSYNSRINICLY